jgi:DNA-3-methyladenine glycosylase
MSIPRKKGNVNKSETSGASGTRLPRAFYHRDTLAVTRDLLGKRVVRLREGERLVGRIVEVEAYRGGEDEASHASPGLTERNAPMFGPSGHAYVYLIYGMYHCLNVVTEREGVPAAVLIRALKPLEGLETMQKLRGSQHPLRNLARGPGRLCEALDIDRSFSGLDLCAEDASLWVEDAPAVPEAHVARSPRIGVSGDERARTVRWRYYLRDSRWVSGKQRFNRRYAEET